MGMGSGEGKTYEFALERFCINFKHFPTQVDSALRILSRTGYLQYTDEQENASRIKFLLRRDELYRIGDLPPQLEKIIQAILRAYGGVFSDYVFIEESLIAYAMGVSRKPHATDATLYFREIYDGLKQLSARHILHYIPRKKSSYITYLQRREEANRIPIKHDIYEARKEAFEKRIKAMVHYTESESICRSRILLNYFGEKNEHNCLVCDVCTRKHSSGLRKGEFEEIAQTIRTILHDGERHAVGELVSAGFDANKISTVLAYMVDQEEVTEDEGGIRMHDK